MQAIKNKGTGVENLFAQALRKEGFYFRRNNRTIIGKPDFSLKKFKIAIFCDSEFWHGKNFEEVKNKRLTTNREYWIKKITRNIERDKFVNQKLEDDGWIVLRFWEKEVYKNLEIIICKIVETLNFAKH